MGNGISQETFAMYQEYVAKSNDILMNMAAPMKTSHVMKIKQLKTLGEQNSAILYAVADMVHFLYGPNSPLPFPPPPDMSTPVEHLQYETRLVSHLRKMLFNDARVPRFEDLSIEMVMFIN